MPVGSRRDDARAAGAPGIGRSLNMPVAVGPGCGDAAKVHGVCAECARCRRARGQFADRLVSQARRATLVFQMNSRRADGCGE